MAVIYATLIVKGKKTFEEVPSKIKNQVKEILIDLKCLNWSQNRSKKSGIELYLNNKKTLI